MDIIGDTHDGVVFNWYASTDWDTTRNATDGNDVLGASSSEDSAICARIMSSGNYSVSRSFLYFDLSGISMGTKCATAVLKVGGMENATSRVCLLQGTQADSLSIADFDAFMDVLLAAVVPWQTSTGPMDLNHFVLNAAGLSYLESAFGGMAKFCLREYDHDHLDVAPSGDYPLFCNGLYYAEQGDPDLSPHLEIEFVCEASLNWSSFDMAMLKLRSILSILLPSLFGHGLHVFFTDRSLFHQVEADLHSKISSLPSDDQSLALELLNFFQRFYRR